MKTLDISSSTTSSMPKSSTRRTFLRWTAGTGTLTSLGSHSAINTAVIGRSSDTEDTKLPPTGNPPALLVVSEGSTDGEGGPGRQSLSRLTFDDEHEEYAVADQYRFGSGQRITDFNTTPDGYAVTLSSADDQSWDARLVLLDSALNPQATRQLTHQTEDSVRVVLGASPTPYKASHRTHEHSLATGDGYIYTASQRGFTVFDGELTQIGWTPIPEEYSGMHIEDVLIHDDVAYIVDDVVLPLYLYRIDISTPRNPSLLEVIPIEGINQTLGQQWLLPATNHWRFVQNTSHMEGGEQYVVTTPIDGAVARETVQWDHGSFAVRADDELQRTKIYSYERTEDGETVNEQGTAIEDIASRPPIYASVDDGETYYLSSVRSQVTFGYELEVGEAARVETTDEHGFALSRKAVLYWFDPDEGVIHLEQELPYDNTLEFEVIT